MTNSRPIVFGLIGFAFLYYSHLSTRKRWAEKAPRLPSNLLPRLIFGCLVFAVIAFLFSAFFTTSLMSTFVNTAVMTVIFTLYLSKVFADMKKYRGKGVSRIQ